LPQALAHTWDIELGTVMFDALYSWPVSSGYSKSELFLTYTEYGQSFAAKMGCAAPYAIYIQNKPTINLIRNPAIAGADRATEEALRIVAEQARNG
jgi:hypothetical protein